MTNIDELMMDALDGTITPANRALLDAHLAQHTEARTAFAQMLRVDAILRETPATPAPADFSHKVMAQARAMPVAKPMRGSQIAAIIAANSVLVGTVWLMMAAVLIGLGLLATQTPALQPVFALARAVGAYVRDALGLAAAGVRAVGAQPLAWIMLLAALALVAAWAGVLAKVLRPQFVRQ
jgi:anti-sigma factor RsiW